MMSISLRRGILPQNSGQFRRQLENLASRNTVNVSKSSGVRCFSCLTGADKHQLITASNQRPSIRAMQSSAPFPVLSPDNIIRSPRDHLDIPNVSLMEYIFSRIDSHPQDSRAVIHSDDDRAYTYGQLKSSIIKVASALTRLGYKKGDTICLFSPNVPEFCIMFIAASAIGAIVTPANPLYSASELARQLEHSQSVGVFTTETFVNVVKEACASVPSVKEIFIVGQAEGCRPFSSLEEDDGKAFPENVDIDAERDILVLPYSSGTTGLPKGVMLSHKNVISNVMQLGAAIQLDRGESILGVLPFYHIYGMVVVQFTSLRDGTSLVTVPRFDPKEFLKIFEKYQVSIAPIVPPIALFLTKLPTLANYDLSRLRLVLSGAAPLGGALQRELSEKLNLPNIVQGYGLTESSPVTHSDFMTPTFGTIGCCLSNTESKVIDPETGELLGPGEEGELCVRGPQVMMGYLNNPEATQNTIKDGWLHTGDICHYDENGCFTVADRLKELIKYKGFQVPPAELEALLISHPEIIDAAVIGVPDDRAGELPRAYVVTAKDSTISETDINAFVDSHVSHYKKLRGGIEFIPQIPKSASGKILRRVLKESL